jgi:hypothetical protein
MNVRGHGLQDRGTTDDTARREFVGGKRLEPGIDRFLLPNFSFLLARTALSLPEADCRS